MNESCSADFVIEFDPVASFELELLRREYLKMLSDLYGDRHPEETIH